ncbi:DHA2 family efflux MFS transporter permease subunit [Virgibacillus sp. NKC19-3]|uniref:DHA2 family efflux MFS transporter permease subunit n=1 Tax=Virgibacillus saliphilus TaxID=2831674 RepID=UPI001C9A8BB8|nr:DHA2 family efflux MFS transporter permease subunit [Virgibacillus sp. NKC19-3]MBY7143864.1 DHA2 family efflux MFS transporter permease subunit [Virgibacillus sp. NKC19-3]
MTQANLSLRHRRLIVAIALSASFLSVLTQFLLITAFPKIMAEFEINASEVQWLTIGYMLALAILIPMTAYLIDRFKTRTLMMGAMILFSLGTLLGLFSLSFEMLLAGRIIQGVGSGMMMPLMQTLLFLVYPREKRGYAMGLAGLVINVAPAIGPPISGVLLNYFQWRSLFLLTLPIAAIILLLIYLFMRNVTQQRETEIDILSILLSSIGFGGILYGFNVIEATGVSEASTIISIGIGVLSLCLFIIRQLRLKKPILELRVFKVPVFALVAIISIMSFSLLISIETILPMYVQSAQQLSALNAGLVVTPGALTLALMSLFAGTLFDKYGGKMITIIGFVLLSISTLSYHLILGLNTSLIIASILFMLAMAGVALINMPIMTAGINALPDTLVAHGTAIINTVRQFGGSIGLTFIISFISSEAAESGTTDAFNFLTGVRTAFFVAFLFAITGLLLSLLLKKEEKSTR